MRLQLASIATIFKHTYTGEGPTILPLYIYVCVPSYNGLSISRC